MKNSKPQKTPAAYVDRSHIFRRGWVRDPMENGLFTSPSKQMDNSVRSFFGTMMSTVHEPRHITFSMRKKRARKGLYEETMINNFASGIN